MAPEAQAVESEIGEPLVPNALGEMIGDRAEQKAPVIGGVTAAAADAQHGVVVDFGLRADRASELLALRPLDLDRGDGEKQRPGKIALGADAGLGDGFFGDEFAEPFGKIGR